MSDLDEARELLEKMAKFNKDSLGSTLGGTKSLVYISHAVELLLKDYVERASQDKRDAEKLR